MIIFVATHLLSSKLVLITPFYPVRLNFVVFFLTPSLHVTHICLLFHVGEVDAYLNIRQVNAIEESIKKANNFIVFFWYFYYSFFSVNGDAFVNSTAICVVIKFVIGPNWNIKKSIFCQKKKNAYVYFKKKYAYFCMYNFRKKNIVTI